MCVCVCVCVCVCARVRVASVIVKCSVLPVLWKMGVTQILFILIKFKSMIMYLKNRHTLVEKLQQVLCPGLAVFPWHLGTAEITSG